MDRKSRKRTDHMLSQAADVDGDCRLARQSLPHRADHAQRMNRLFRACRLLRDLAVEPLELSGVAFACALFGPEAGAKRRPSLP